jgi:hypothetical protein
VACTVAPPGFNRWLVPLCALAFHMCIGMAYGFSVIWLLAVLCRQILNFGGLKVTHV